MRIGTRILTSLFFLVASAAGVSADDAGFSHDDWADTLTRFVDARGRVNYVALAQERKVFDRYLASLAEVGPDTHPQLFPDEKAELAYFINAYNALVFQGVLAGGGEQESAWKSALGGAKFFLFTRYRVGGDKTSLKGLEDNQVRERYGDPRAHAALNCAAVSCPRLPQVPFTGPELDAQLDAAMREFVNDERHVTLDRANTKVHLSKIFDWFKKDFLAYERQQGSADPSVIDYINRFRPPGAQLPRDYRVAIRDYDRSLNKP